MKKAEHRRIDAFVEADGMSTLLFILPPEEGKKLVGGENGLPAMFIEEAEGKLKVTKDEAWLRMEKAGK